jgi:hypothetical protein
MFALAAGFVLASAGLVNAAMVNDLISAPPEKIVFGSDESRQDLLNLVGADPSIIDVGDVLYGIFPIPQLNVNGTSYEMQHVYGNSEWTAEFAIQVAAKIATGAVDPGSGLPIYTVVFAPYAPFDVAKDGLLDGTMVRMYEDTGLTHFDVDDDASAPARTQAGATATVTDGSYYWSLGYVRGSNAWVGQGIDDISAVGSVADRLGSAVFALDRTSETFAFAGLGAGLAMVDKSNATGTGEIKGTANIGGPVVNSPWPLSDNANVEFTIVPEPFTLTFLGFGAIGVLRIRRRARSRR